MLLCTRLVKNLKTVNFPEKLTKMVGHGHSHSCGHHANDADHVHDDEELGVQYSLFMQIDTVRLVTYNEHLENAGKVVFRTWDERKNRTNYVESDSEGDLLFSVPFTSCVKLKAIRISGEQGDLHPASVKLFKDRPNMTLDDVDGACEQEFELIEDLTSDVEYPLRASKFNGIHHLGIYIPRSKGDHDDAPSRVFYIGLRGEHTKAQRQQAVTAVYEARAIPKDHKASASDKVHGNIGF